MGILFALLAMVLWGLEEFLLKEAILGLRSVTTFLINTLAGVVIQLLIIALIFGGGVTVLWGADLALVLLTALISFLGYLFFYLALERQELSLVAALDESWIIIAVIVGVFFFGESLSLLHLGAIAAVLLGAFLVSVDFSQLKHLKLISGSGLEFVSIALIGIAVPLEKIVIERLGEANAIFYLVVPVIPMIFIAKALMRQKFVRPSKKLWGYGIASGVADGFSYVFFLLALKTTNISIVSPIAASSVVVSLILARSYLKEKLTRLELLGAALILAGVLALSTVVKL